MEIPHPIKLPHELEKEAEEARIRTIEERVETHRKNGTLLSSIIEFLEQFEVKIVECNRYMQLYIPYPTISQTTKDNVRNKLRTLNDFYFSYTGSNPHHLICECLKNDTAEARALNDLYKQLSDLINRLNNNVLCISNKQIVYISKRKQKDDSIWNEYDWA